MGVMEDGSREASTPNVLISRLKWTKVLGAARISSAVHSLTAFEKHKQQQTKQILSPAQHEGMYGQ